MILKIICTLLFFIFNTVSFAQISNTDSTDLNDQKIPEMFLNDNDIKTDITRKPKRIYINHYRYRFSIIPSVSFYNIHGKNPTWAVSNTIRNISIDLKLSCSITDHHKINLDINPGLLATSGKIKYTSSLINADNEHFRPFISNIDLGYSYLQPVSENTYLAAGGGLQLLFFDTNNKVIHFDETNFSYYLDFSFLRQLTRDYNLFFDVSYSGHKIHPVILKNDLLSIDVIQIKIGIQFLTVISDMFYSS